MRYARIASANVALSAHVREDSRYAILPVMRPSSVTGWVIYDALVGEIVKSDSDGGVFASLSEAKGWLDTHQPNVA